MLSVQQMLLGAVPGSTGPEIYPDMGLGKSMVAGSMYNNGGSNAIVPNSDGAFSVGAGDYTIEWWMWMAPDSRYNGRQWQMGTWPSAPFGVSIEGSGKNRTFYLWANGAKTNNAVPITSANAFYSHWHHWCVERISGTTTVYLDGVSFASTTAYYNVTSTEDVRLSAEGNGTNPMHGYLSDFHVMKGAYKYGGNFTPPTTSITATANTTLLLNMVTDFTDSSTNNKTITPDGVSWNQRGPYLAPQIWLDGSTDSYSGSGWTWNNLGRHDCSAQLYSQMAVIDGAMNFNDYYGAVGAYAYLSGGTYPILKYLNNGITVVAVYDLLSADNWERIIDFGSGSPKNNIILARLSTSDNLVWDIYGKTNAEVFRAGNGAAASGKKLAIATNDSNSQNLYTASGNVQGSGIALPAGVKTNMYIGKSNWGADAPLQGKIYHLSIYDRVLTSDEIAHVQSILNTQYGL